MITVCVEFCDNKTYDRSGDLIVMNRLERRSRQRHWVYRFTFQALVLSPTILFEGTTLDV